MLEMIQKHNDRWNSRNVWMTFNVHVMCLAPCIETCCLKSTVVQWHCVQWWTSWAHSSENHFYGYVLCTPYIVCCTCMLYVAHKNQIYLGLYQFTTNSHQKLIHIIMKNAEVDCFKPCAITRYDFHHKYKSCLWN